MIALVIRHSKYLHENHRPECVNPTSSIIHIKTYHNNHNTSCVFFSHAIHEPLTKQNSSNKPQNTFQTETLWPPPPTHQESWSTQGSQMLTKSDPSSVSNSIHTRTTFPPAPTAMSHSQFWSCVGLTLNTPAVATAPEVGPRGLWYFKGKLWWISIMK